MNTGKNVYTTLGNESLWDVAARCHDLLTDAAIDYSDCGGVAVCLFGYQRNTTDFGLVIRSEDSDSGRTVLTDAGFARDAKKAEFRTADGITIRFLIAGQRAGKDGEFSVFEPVGERNVEQIDGLSVVRLFRLIEMRIACGMSNLRRTHKDIRRCGGIDRNPPPQGIVRTLFAQVAPPHTSRTRSQCRRIRAITIACIDVGYTESVSDATTGFAACVVINDWSDTASATEHIVNLSNVRHDQRGLQA